MACILCQWLFIILISDNLTRAIAEAGFLLIKRDKLALQQRHHLTTLIDLGCSLVTIGGLLKATGSKVTRGDSLVKL